MRNKFVGLMIVEGMTQAEYEQVKAEFDTLPKSGTVINLPLGVTFTSIDPTNADPTLTQFYDPRDDPDSDVWRNMRIGG